MDEVVDTAMPETVSVPPSSATWQETWTNIGAPALFGMLVGALWQVQVQPHLPYPIPNPIHAALLLFLFLSPLFHRGSPRMTVRGGRNTSEVWRFSLCFSEAFGPRALAH